MVIKNRVKFFFSFLLTFPLAVQAQSYFLTGEVIDKATLSKIEGVYITFDGHGVLTDKFGAFSIPVSGATARKKLTFSHIGYRSKRLTCSAGKKNKIMLESKTTLLGEVTITPKKSILEQAIERIPINYPTRPVMQKGLIRLHRIVEECDYFFRGDAIVDLYTPTYGSTRQKQQIRIQSNKHTEVNNWKEECAKKHLPDWVSAYATIGDVVFQKPAFISADKLAGYSYHSKGVIDYCGRRTYRLSFVSKGTKQEGVIYIDSLTKAFSAIEYTNYDIHKFPFIPTAVLKIKWEYQLHNGKWYINKKRSRSIYDGKYPGVTMQEFQSLEIDSLDAKPIPYSETVQYMDEVTTILKKDTLGINYDTLAAKHERDSSFTVIPIPESKGPVLKKKSKRWYNLLYIIQPAIAFRYVPTTSAYPSYPNTMGDELSFPAYKKLSVRLGFYYNYGIGAFDIQYLALSLEREMICNINHRPIRIIPHTGFSFPFSKEKETGNSSASVNYMAGVRIAIEVGMGRRASFFVDGDYLQNIKGKTLSNALHAVSLSTGVMFHLKKSNYYDKP